MRVRARPRAHAYIYIRESHSVLTCMDMWHVLAPKERRNTVMDKIKRAEDTGNMRTYRVTGDVIRDFCYDAMRSGEYPTDEQIKALINKSRDDGAMYLPYYVFDLRPNVVFGYEFEDDPKNPESIIKQQHLTCGHWCSTFYRYCPHCGAMIVSMGEVPDFIIPRAIAAEQRKQEI